MAHESELSPRAALEVGALLASVLIIAICGLIYELLIGALSSYLLGDSIYQFSLTIGFFLTAMGIGSWLSRFLQHELLQTFLLVELAIGLLGGFSAPLLFATYAASPESYLVVMIALLLVLGTLTGLEIPLLTRIASEYGSLRSTLANVLAFDYVGALVAALLFPLVLLPVLGLVKTSFVVGACNVLVVGVNLRAFGQRLPQARMFTLATLAGLLILVGGFTQSALAVSLFEQRLYTDAIIYTEQTPFQRIVVTRYKDDLRLFLDSELQLSSRDEYRYHESLVHPGLALARVREHVLVIGGGDGMALREVWKYADVQRATLVDLDPAMTRLGQTYPPLVSLNVGALSDPRLDIVTADGYRFLSESSDLYQAIIIDLPDPRSETLARLYSREFYALVKRHLARGGVVVTQASSPYFAREAFWCIAHTIESAGLVAVPYHVYIPSFGDWGFVLASDLSLDWNRITLDSPLRFLTPQQLNDMRTFDPDTAEVTTDTSSLENATVWRYYLQGWQRWRG